MNLFSKGKIPALVLMGLAAGSSLHADGGVPHPELIFLEAEEEAPLNGESWKITSPLLVKDDPLASNGSYVEVLGGNNSTAAAPATEGVLSLAFSQTETSASFTIWARVKAATTGDDSFWFKMDGGAPINASLPLGTAWHWVQIKASGSSTAAKFTLDRGSHTLTIAYREDGAKLDQIIITSNPNYNPGSSATPLIAPYLNTNYSATTATGSLLSWSEIPGAVSYSLVKITSTGESIVYTGKDHSRTVSGGDAYYVYANASNGSRIPSDASTVGSWEFSQRYRIPYYGMSVTSPMEIGSQGTGTFLYTGPNSGTASSLNVAPVHGRGRYDFRIATATNVRIYGEVNAPNTGSDSYWVRMDQGAWVKWNNIPDFTCSPVRNSDAGNAIVNYQVAAGSHSLEFAYRETGTGLERFGIIPSNSSNTNACED
jgi:hypothetical protein